MRLRELATVVGSLTFLACGRNSTPTAPTSTVLDLLPGTYALTITMSSSGEPVCNNGLCVSVSLCGGGTGAPPSVRALTTVVRLDRSGDAITIHPEDTSASFRMDLRIAANTVSGTASGQFRDPTLQLSLVIAAGQPGQPAAVATGTVLTTSVAGKIDGQVGVGGYSCSNNGHTWTMVPR
jgi:hypothetical protein